jgi:predicted dehydrogenase
MGQTNATTGTGTCAPGKKADFKVGVIGYGYWGPNIVRNFCSLESASVVSVCDKNPKALKKVQSLYPSVVVTENDEEILKSKEIDIVAIITPVSAHHELAKQALLNGKHVFVEKPFTATVAQAEELIEIAAKKKLQIMVDHTFLFTGAVKKIKQFVDEGALGELFYYDSMRVNLGLFQHDVNVIWDLAPHDFAIMDYVISEKPVAITANGKAHFGNGLEDVAYVTVYFPSNIIAHFNVNWLSPVKVRTTLIGGEKKMLVWNDLEADEKIKVYDKGVEVKNRESVYQLLVSYRSGDMWAPKVEQIEALKQETQYFLDCVAGGKAPLNDGQSGLRVVKMLEACNRSLKENGHLIYL